MFAARAISHIARASGGLTRRINILADKSLLAAFTENTHAVTERHVRAAVADSEFAQVVKPAGSRAAVWLGAALAAGIALGAGIPWVFFALETKPVAPAPTVQPKKMDVPQPAVEVPPPVKAAPAPRLDPAQQSRLVAYSPAGQKLLAERIAATREVLDRAPGERYSIELFTTDNPDPARMERFLMRARDWVPLAELFVIPMANGERVPPQAPRYRLRVVLGEFESHEQALEAVRRLPPKYQQAFRAAPRSFGELRSQI